MLEKIINIISMMIILPNYRIFFGKIDMKIMYILDLISFPIFSSMLIIISKFIISKEEVNTVNKVIYMFIKNSTISMLTYSITLTLIPINSINIEEIIFVCIVFFLIPLIIIFIIYISIYIYINNLWNKFLGLYGLKTIVILFIILTILFNLLNLVKSFIISQGNIF